MQKTLCYFYANWCGPCKMLAPVLEQFANDMPDVQVVKVDVDVVSDVAKEFGVVIVNSLIELFSNISIAQINQIINIKEKFILFFQFAYTILL